MHSLTVKMSLLKSHLCKSHYRIILRQSKIGFPSRTYWILRFLKILSVMIEYWFPREEPDLCINLASFRMARTSSRLICLTKSCCQLRCFQARFRKCLYFQKCFICPWLQPKGQNLWEESISSQFVGIVWWKVSRNQHFL